MNFAKLEKLRNCCRDQAAFEQMQPISSSTHSSFQVERQRVALNYELLARLRNLGI